MSVYNLPNMPTLPELITEMIEHTVFGWCPVYDEAIVYSSSTDSYTLSAGDASSLDIHDILYVIGTSEDFEYMFISDTDYEILDTTGNGKNDSFHWVDDGTSPDDATTFYVSYRYQTTASGITDITPGSVFRTLVESFGIQLYRAFLKIQEVGRDSFVETAVGPSLGLLGKIVGIDRNPATRSTGFATLKRDSTSTTSTVDIPIGTRLSTVGTSTVPSVQFQTTSTARIMAGETIAVTYTSTEDPDYLQPWVAIESIDLGVDGNVSSGVIIRNITAPSSITYVNNLSTYDVSGEQLSGDGSTQMFDLAHTPSEVSSVGGKYIQYLRGFISQPSVPTTIEVELTPAGSYENPTESVSVTIYGVVSGNPTSETLTTDLDDGNTSKTTSNLFSAIYYVTFINNDDPTEGIGEGIGVNATVTITDGDAETYLDGQAPGVRVDSGYLDMTGDEDYIWLYIWQDNSWRLKTIGTTGSGTNEIHYVDEDTGSYNAGVIYWNDGLGGGSTWTGTTPYFSNYGSGPNADGENIRIEYTPISGETGTGASEDISSGISAIVMTEEYKYGWLDQPSSVGEFIRVTSVNSGGTPTAWSGAVIIHGDTTMGGEDDEEALIFDADTLQTTVKKFTKISYIMFSNTNNPSEGFGEGSASSLYARVGTTVDDDAFMEASQCGTRVDGGHLSLVGVDSDTTLKVYVHVYNSGWVLHDQADSDYIYTDTGTTAGVIDLSAIWVWDTPPYENLYNAGPFGDGRNIKIEYVPTVEQYTVSGSQLGLEGTPTLGSTLTVSYTWDNEFVDGSNTEIDIDYRSRIRTSISSSAKSTLQAIANAVLDVDNVVGVVVDDHSTDPSIDVGEVHVFAWTSSGIMDSGTRSLVALAVNDTRAAGVKPIVQSPISIYIAIEASVKVPTSSSRTRTTIKADLDTAVTSYVNGLGINQVMYKSELVQVMESISEVRYVDIKSIEVWGYDSDTATAVSQVAPYTSTPYWHFESVTQDWSGDGNIIYINSGYVFRADIEDTDEGNNKAINISVEYE